MNGSKMLFFDLNNRLKKLFSMKIEYNRNNMRKKMLQGRFHKTIVDIKKNNYKIKFFFIKIKKKKRA